MSYAITVTVKDGQAEAVVSGPAPDGRYDISGHIDADREDISVGRVTAEQHLASRSSGTVYKGV